MTTDPPMAPAAPQAPALPPIVEHPSDPHAGKRFSMTTKAVVVGLLLLVAGSAVAYRNHVWPFSWGLSDQELVSGLPAKLSEIGYARYNLGLSIVSKPRVPDAEPLTQELMDFGSSEDAYGSDRSVLPLSALGNLPSDIDLQIVIDGTSQTVSVDGLGAQFHAGTALKAGDFTIEADGDFLMVDGVMYVRVNKFPGLFVDLGPIKGTWIKITKEDLEGSSYDFPSEVADFGDEQASQSAQVATQIQKVYALGLTSGFFRLTRITQNDATVPNSIRRFTTSTDPSKLASFYREAAEALTEYGDRAIMKYDQATFDLLSTPDFLRLYAYLSANTVTEVWIDKNGFPVKLTSTYQFIPDASYAPNLRDVQFAISETLQFTDINTPVSVTAPADTMSYEDAAISLSGKSPEVYRAIQQSSRVSSLRYTLEHYKSIMGSYPSSLDDLLKTPRQLGVTEVPFWSLDTAFLDVLPKDYYTKTVYPYETVGGDYRLTYTMIIPAQDPDAVTWYDFESFVNGTNHATSNYLSEEQRSVY